MDDKRRELLKLGALFGLGSVPGMASASARPATPPEMEGPFYPVVAQADRDFDLTRIEGKDGQAQGEVITIEGRVVDTNGAPVAGASVDVWQANAFGRYRHPNDPNPAPLDDNFQGWAIVTTGTEGRFRFRTVMPGAYPASGSWMRPPHIHFKVSKRGHPELVTQMYFQGNDLNGADRLLRRKSVDEQAMMIATDRGPDASGITSYAYEIVLETV